MILPKWVQSRKFNFNSKFQLLVLYSNLEVSSMISKIFFLYDIWYCIFMILDNCIGLYFQFCMNISSLCGKNLICKFRGQMQILICKKWAPILKPHMCDFWSPRFTSFNDIYIANWLFFCVSCNFFLLHMIFCI